MKLAVRITGVSGLAARLEARALPRAEGAALEGAARDLSRALAEASGASVARQEGRTGPVLAVRDAVAVQRETGSLDVPATPWLMAAVFGVLRRGRRP